MANLATINDNILADSGIDPINLIVGTGTVNYIPKFTAEGAIGNSIMTESGANILISSNIVLHAGNYNSYAPTLTGGGASGTWGINISGNAATATNADTVDGLHASAFALTGGSNATGTWPISVTGTSGYANSAGTAGLVNGTSGGAIQSWDIRTIAPSSMVAYRMGFGFTSWANNNSAPYADYLHLRSYSDASGGNDNLIMFLKSGFGMRIYQQAWGSSAPYTSYVDMLHSGNYTDFTVTKTGGGASGTWGISITGNADTLDGYHAASFAFADGSNASGTWGINISGNSATVTNGVYTTGSYSNPSWLTALAWSKITSTPTTLAGYGITDGVSTSGSYSNPSWITALAWGKITGTPTTLAGYGITDAVPSSRTLTINGVSYDLSANRSWTIAAGVTSILAGAGISVDQNQGDVTVSNTGVLSVNGGTGAITGIATTAQLANYLPLAGGTMSGSINMGSNNITNVAQLQASYAIFTNDASSRVMYLRGAGNIIQFQDAAAANKWEVVGREGQFYVYKNDGTGSGYKWQIDNSGYHIFTGDAYFNNSVHGPIYYDSNDTAFYGNFASTSRFYITRHESISDTSYVRLVNPGGGYNVNSSPLTAAIKIKLPIAASYTNTMLSFTVKIYNYQTGTSRTIYVGGYNYYTTDWYNVFAYQIGDNDGGNLTVRFGKDGTGNCVWIGETDTYWSYPNVFITDVQSGHSQPTGMATGWSISFVTSFDSVQTSRVAYSQINAGNIGSQSVNYAANAGNANTLDGYDSSAFAFANGSNATGTWGINISGNSATTSQTNFTTLTLGGNGVATQAWVNSQGFVTGGPYVPTSRTLTINGVTYDLSANRSWTIASSGVNSIIAGTGIAVDQPQGDVRVSNTGVLSVNGSTGDITGVLTTSNYSSTLDSVYLKGTTSPSTPGNFTLSIGNNGSYSYVQSHSSQPLYLNPVGNSVFIGSSNVVLHSGNYNSYAPTLTGGGASGTWGINVTGSASIASQVTINYNNDSNSTYQLLWGSGNSVYGTGGVYVNPSTDTIYSYAYRGNGNVAGTGEAIYLPAGIYSTGTNWLYGTLYMSSNNMRDIGGIVQNNLVGRPNAQWGAGGSTTGAVVIKFPGGTGNYGMVHAVIDIYEYNGNNVTTVIVGGHNWGSQWYSYGANVVGYTNKQVRVGVKDGQYCIVIGDGSSSWSYGQVVLRKIQNGSYYSGVMDVGAGYTIQIESDTYSWISGDLRTFRSSGNIYMNEALVATQSWVSSQGYVTGGPYLPLAGGTVSGATTFNGNMTWFNGQGSQIALENIGSFARFAFNGLDFYDWQYGISMTISNGDITATGSFRAPIFYDSNDTNYYLDPNSTSVLYDVYVNGDIRMRGSDSYIWMPENNAYSTGFYDPTTGLVALNINAPSDGVFFGDTMWVSYNKSNNNNYNENIRLFPSANGASVIAFRAAAGSTGGSPDNSILGYSDRLEIRQGNQWQMRSYANYVEAYGSFRAPIFYDSQDTSYYVDPNSVSRLSGVAIGESYYGHGYPGIVQSGSTGYNYNFYNGSWSSTITVGYLANCSDQWEFAIHDSGHRVASVFLFDGGGTNRILMGRDLGWGATYIEAASSFRAPIFYDSNDTSYYLDPNSNSRLNIVRAYRFENNDSVSSDSTFGIYFGNGDGNAYAIYRAAGAWTHPYPDLRIAFHTGIQIGANASYQGVRFYTDYDMATQVMSVNNGSDPLGGGNVYVNNSLQAGSSLRAPIFYDSEDTSYYVDPNNTSNLRTANILNTYVGNAIYFGGGNNYLNWDGARINSNVGIQSSVDMRAPIFYDSNDTSWYLDPNGVSNLRTVRVQALNSPNGDSVVAADSAMPAYQSSFIHTLGLGPGGNDGHILGMSWTNTSIYGAQIWLDTDPNDIMAIRSRSSAGVWTSWKTILHSGNYNSYAPTLTGGGASGTWGINITGNANYANSAASSGSSNALNITGYGAGNMTYYQTSGTFAGYSGWAGYFVSNHGDGATYYNQTIIMPFWGAPQYSRLEGGTFRGPFTFVTTENSPYAYNMNQYVRTTDNVSFNQVTAGGFFESSDARLKTIVDENYRLDSIVSIKPKFYEKNGKFEAGYIAQEVQEIYSHAVTLGVDGYLSLSYGQIHTLKIAALEDSVDEIKKKIQELEEKLNTLH